MRPDESRTASNENSHKASVRTEPIPGKRRLVIALSIFSVFVISSAATVLFELWPELTRPSWVDPALQLPAPLDLASLPNAPRFDFPIGGENSDLGDPIFAVADGRVLLGRDGGPGWGNIVILLHAYLENGERKYVQSHYGHVEKMLVHAGDEVHRGQQIATVGTAGGRYFAHLHFEMREFTTPFIGPGYRENTQGWINPAAFIQAHRGAPNDDVGRTPK